MKVNEEQGRLRIRNSCVDQIFGIKIITEEYSGCKVASSIHKFRESKEQWMGKPGMFLRLMM